MTVDYDARAEELGLNLYHVATPKAGYTPAVTTGNLVFLSGHGPFEDGVQRYKGKVGLDYTVEEAGEIAEFVALGCLSTLRAHLGTFNRVKQVVRATGYVNATPDCEGYFWVTDSATNIVKSLFGEAGNHARMSIGCSILPRNVPFAFDMIVEIHPE